MKRMMTHCVKSMHSVVRDIETDQVAKAIQNANFPVSLGRSRTSNTLEKLKWFAVPALGLLALGGYAVYRGYQSREEVKAWFNSRWADTRPQDPDTGIQEKEKTDELNTVHDVSQDAFPASDSPADKNGVSEQAKHPESIS